MKLLPTPATFIPLILNNLCPRYPREGEGGGGYTLGSEINLFLLVLPSQPQCAKRDFLCGQPYSHSMVPGGLEVMS
jgi:hypothetical protein